MKRTLLLALLLALPPSCLACSREAEQAAPAGAAAKTAAPVAQSASASTDSRQESDATAPPPQAAATAVASAAGDEPATGRDSPPPAGETKSKAPAHRRAGRGTKRRNELGGLGTPGGGADPLAAVSLPDMRACAKHCYAENQMRAVAPEQIESDCRKSCHTECLTYCEQSKEDRPATFEQACRHDCDIQQQRLASSP